MERCDVCGAEVGTGGACPRCDSADATRLLTLDVVSESAPGVVGPPTEVERPTRRPRLPAVVLAVSLVVVVVAVVWAPGGDEPSPAPADSEPGRVAIPASESATGTGQGASRTDPDPDAVRGEGAGFVPFTVGNTVPRVSEAGFVAEDLPREMAGLRIGVRAGAEVLVVDLGEVTVRVIESDYGPSLLNAGGFVLTADDVVVVDDERALLVSLDVSRGAIADLGDAADAVGAPGDQRVWLIDAPDAPPGFATAREIVAAGTGAYSGVDVGFGSRTFASRAVPAGLVVVNVLAGTWIHDGGEWRAVHDGKSLASYADLVVVRECRSADSCGAFRIDLSTGERVVASHVAVDLVAEGAQLLLEPAGASAVFHDPAGRIGRVDVISGETRTLSVWGGPRSTLLGLSPGGRWLFAFDGVDEVVAFDLTGGVKGAVVVLEGLDASIDVETFQVVVARD